MAESYDIAALGNAIVDVLAPVDGEFLLKHSIAKGVMTLIDEFRARELLAVMTGTREIAGGSAANTMAGVASFGGTGLFVGKVKDDRLGHAFAASMGGSGIAFETPKAAEGPSTACCVIAVTQDGERSMNTYLGACRELGPADIDATRVARAKVLYVEGYLWDAPEAKAAINRAMDAVREAGGKVAFTLSDPFCVGRWREEFLQLWKHDLDILFANEEEAKTLFEVESFEDAAAQLCGWNGIAAVTRSEKGCVIMQGDTSHALPAFPLAKIVDTTGAGDQFAAGFLYGLTHGKALADCGRLGALAAAEVISHYGARPEAKLSELAAKHGL